MSTATGAGTPQAGTLDLSVIIVTYNRGPTLLRTLESVLAQSPAAREVIVVDQTPQPTPAVKAQLDRWTAAGAIRYLFQAEPNAQRARNRAISEATCGVLLFLDDDVILYRGMMAAHLINYSVPEIHAVGGFYTEPTDQRTDKLGTAVWWRPLTKMQVVPATYTRRVDSLLWPSCNGSIRRETILKLGGFDENYKYTLLDDTDLAARMMKSRYLCVHDPEAGLMHLKEPSGGARPATSRDQVIASRAMWFTWFYFFLMNFGLFGSGEIAFRLRTCVFRLPYFKRPRLLRLACLEAFHGMRMGLKAIQSGRKLMQRHAESDRNNIEVQKP